MIFDCGTLTLGRLTSSFFFFQAEDGIRDRNVTGVQTCALPISSAPAPPALFDSPEPLEFTLTTNLKAVDKDRGTDRHYHPAVLSFSGPDHAPATQIGRASCRERV